MTIGSKMKVKCEGGSVVEATKNATSGEYEFSSTATPTHYYFATDQVTATSNNIDISALTNTNGIQLGTATDNSYSETLPASGIQTYTVNISRYAGSTDAPALTISGVNVGTAAHTDGTDTYTYTFTTNKSLDSAKATLAGCTDAAVTFAQGSTTANVEFANPYKDYTYYFDATYAINNSREAGSTGNEVSTTRTDWHSPVMYYLADGVQVSKSVKMTEIATGIFSATATCLKKVDKIWFECEKDGSGKVDRKIDEVKTPTADYIYAAKSHAQAGNYSFGITSGEAYSTNHDAAADKKTYTIKVQAFKGKDFAPEVKLYAVAADATIGENSPQLAAPKKVTGVDGTNADGKERVIYTYTYTSVDKNVTGPTAKVVFDKVPSQAAITAGQITVFDFPKLGVVYRLGSAVHGMGNVGTDGKFTSGTPLEWNEQLKGFTGEAEVTAEIGAKTKDVLGIAAVLTKDGVPSSADSDRKFLRTNDAVLVSQSTTTPLTVVNGGSGLEHDALPVGTKLSVVYKPTATKEFDEGTLDIKVFHKYTVELTEGSPALTDYFTAGALQVATSENNNNVWANSVDTEGKTFWLEQAPVKYKKHYSKKEGVAASEANAGNIKAEGSLTQQGSSFTYTATMASPLVYTVKVTNAVAAPSNTEFEVDGKPYANFYTAAPAEGSNVYTYTLITDQHAAGTKGKFKLTVNGDTQTVTDIIPGTEAAYTVKKTFNYSLHVCGDSGSNNAKLFPDGWDDNANGVLNKMQTEDGLTFTWSATVPAGFNYIYSETKDGNTTYKRDFGLRYKKVNELKWLQGTGTGTIENGVAMNTGDVNFKMPDYTFQNETKVTFTFVRNSESVTSGTLTVSWEDKAPEVVETGNAITRISPTSTNTDLQLDFSTAVVEFTKSDNTTVTVKEKTELTKDDISSAKFVSGIKVKGSVGSAVDASANFANWPATVTANADGSLVVTADAIPANVRTYKFVYHDWRETPKPAKSVTVSIKVAEGQPAKTMTAWRVSDGTSTARRAVAEGGADNTTDGKNNTGVDHYYPNTAVPAGAPGQDYVYAVATSDETVDFANATATIVPDAEANSGAVNSTVVFPATLPVADVPVSYASSEYRLYRTGSAVGWNLNNAIEYVSNTGLFYIDNLKKGGVQTINGKEEGIGYKFSTHDPRGDNNDWDKGFDAGTVGYHAKQGEDVFYIGKVNTDNTTEAETLPILAYGTGGANVAPAFDGTLVIDLRGGTKEKPGTMTMYPDFYRIEGKSQFYGSATLVGKQILLTGVGLNNNDATQVVSVENNDAKTKHYLYECVDGYKVTVKDANGTEVANKEATGQKLTTDHYEFGTITIDLTAEPAKNATYTVNVDLIGKEVNQIDAVNDRFATLTKTLKVHAIQCGSRDNVGGLDFSGADIVVTKQDNSTVTIKSTDGFISLEEKDIKFAEFGAGVKIVGADKKEVPEALNNFVYATNGNRWPATTTVGTDGTFSFYANKTDNAQYYSFCYHDWRTNNNVNNMGASKVEVKLANDGGTLVAWLTNTPGLLEGSDNKSPEHDDLNLRTEGPELLANGGQNFDKSYGMVANPPKGAPGHDYWFMVMTDKPGVNFRNAVITVYPKAHEVSGAIPVHMTLTEDILPSTDISQAHDRVIRHCMNSQFRIYRVGTEVDWRLDKATEYVSNTGVFYVDGLIKNDTSHDQLGIGYKFSTIDPRGDYDAEKKTNNWTNFNKGVFGYTIWSSTERQDIKNGDQRDLYWGNESKEGNVSPAVNGTLVIDLREFVNSVDMPQKGNKYGFLNMHEGFFRQTNNNTMLFYGGVNTPGNTIQLSKVGLWNNDACQVIDFGTSPDYNKKYFYEIVGGFEVEVKDANGNVIDVNGADEGTNFVYKHAGTDKYTEDYEFLNENGSPLFSLPAMLPGTYSLSVRLLPVDEYKDKWTNTICAPLELKATIVGTPMNVTFQNVSLARVDFSSEADYIDATEAHKGYSEHFPVKYTGVNEVSAFVYPSNGPANATYEFKIGDAKLTQEEITGQDVVTYKISGLPFDAATNQTKDFVLTVVPTVTVDGSVIAQASVNIQVDAMSVANATFPSKFADVKLGDGTQVVVTGATVGNAKYYVYSANPVFEVTQAAVANGTEGQSTSTGLYNVGGFEFNIDNISKGVKLSDKTQTEDYTLIDGINDWAFSCEADGTVHLDPRMAFSAKSQRGLAGYSYYDGADWNNTTNNWAEMMIDKTSFGMLIPHYYACAKGYSGDKVPQHGGFEATFYTYYPVRNADGTVSLVEVPGNKLTVSGSETGSGVTGVENVTVDADALLDVYTLSGVRVMHNVSRDEALKQLQPGIYLIGREKVAVQ